MAGNKHLHLCFICHSLLCIAKQNKDIWYESNKLEV